MIDNIETIIENSYKDFHAKGLDYICLSRSPEKTRKVYFLNGDVTKVPEVINPHDHRYNFETTVLAGEMSDHVYLPDEHGMPYQVFDYMTPLNGGNGFTYQGEIPLTKDRIERRCVGEFLRRSASTLHTIQMHRDQTVLLLTQYADIIPIDRPTTCFVRKGEPKPDTSGLYTKFTADEVLQRIDVITRLFRKNTMIPFWDSGK